MRGSHRNCDYTDILLIYNLMQLVDLNPLRFGSCPMTVAYQNQLNIVPILVVDRPQCRLFLPRGYNREPLCLPLPVSYALPPIPKSTHSFKPNAATDIFFCQRENRIQFIFIESSQIIWPELYFKIHVVVQKRP